MLDSKNPSSTSSSIYVPNENYDVIFNVGVPMIGTAVTKFVNGGTNGLADREEYFHSFLNDPTITKIDTASSTPSGGSVATASNEVSSGQRQQAKSQTPMIINTPTTNNTKVVNNQPATMTKDKANPTNMVLARVA